MYAKQNVTHFFASITSNHPGQRGGAGGNGHVIVVKGAAAP
jgi:hypothetical protein